MTEHTESRDHRSRLALVLFAATLLALLIWPGAVSAHPDNASSEAYRYEKDSFPEGPLPSVVAHPLGPGYPHCLADPLGDKGTKVKTSDGDHWAGTFRLDWNGSYIVPVFCFDLQHGTDSGECYAEDGPTVPSVTWLLSNGYGPDDATTDNEAAAYQAAVWHYTDGVDLYSGSPTPSGVKTIYDDVIAACEAAKPWPMDQQNIQITLEPNGQIFFFDDCTFPDPHPSPLTVPMTVTVTDAGQPVAGKTLSVEELNGVGTLSTDEVTTNGSGQAFFSIAHDVERVTARVRVYGQFQISAGVALEPETSGTQRLMRGASYVGTRDAEATVTWLCGGRLIAHKFYDSNLNGVQDSGEANIEGWKMWHCWSSSPGSWGTHRKTNADGNAIWGVKPRLWDVKEQTGSSWHNTTPSVVYNVRVVAGGSATVNFGNVKKPIIEVYKFWDKDGDGTYEPSKGETLLTDWWFDLYWKKDGQWNLRASQMTGSDGKVVWTGYTGITDTGDYKVVERVKPGWEPTTPGGDPTRPCGLATATHAQTTTWSFTVTTWTVMPRPPLSSTSFTGAPCTMNQT